MANTLDAQVICEMIEQATAPWAKAMLVVAYYCNGDDREVAEAFWKNPPKLEGKS